MKSTGRPRDASVDEKVIKATLDAINEDGLAGLSIDGIAARAGVSKASMYRRWASKEELVVDAIASLAGAIGQVTTGNTREDLTTVVNEFRGLLSSSPAGEVFPWLAGEIASGSAIGLRYASTVMAPRQAAIAAVIRSGVERGDLRGDLPIDTAVDMMLGPILARRLRGSLEDSSETWAEDIVDALLSGWVAQR